MKEKEISIAQVVNEPCPSEAFIQADVCIPVDITPFANPLPTETFCCGEPDIAFATPEIPNCPGEESIRILITQEICVRVPVEIGVTPIVGEPLISNAIIVEDCEDCGDDDDDDDDAQ